MKKSFLFIVLVLMLLNFSACTYSQNTESYATESASKKYTVGAYYSTKRDRSYIYFDELEQVAYWGSKQGSTIHHFAYIGSILDEEEGAIDNSTGCIYKLNGNTIKKIKPDGRELQTYSVIGYDIAMHKDLKD